jgi:HPt (histidine-containing phosphotransfer) domain-containing protein
MPEAELPLIDQRALDDWSGDLEREDVLAILGRVPEEAGRSIADLRKAVTARDLVSARRIAHRLKGMASNLGAVRLARMARAIELTSQSVDDVSGRMATLEQTVADTLEALGSCRQSIG